ncbi:MAG: tetrahydromethanopterin S-methyltransferase subunit A [Methanothrix sp.]|nr:MAG: tetrahydromethanopterin S-methyltransferase subunit A [Methanothrix sp.]
MTEECSSQRKCFEESWPPVRGEYVVGDPNARVAVVTLASQLHVRGSAISGPCKTENLGVEKIVANVVSNCNIRFILLCGAESKGHLPGNTLLALHRNGIDEQGRIVGSKGAIPFIQNLAPDAILRFQEQVQLIDFIGLEDEAKIAELVEIYNSRAEPYPREPFQVVKKKSTAKVISAGEGDLLLGSGVVMNTATWLVQAEVVVEC